jgi:hypothetical protein
MFTTKECCHIHEGDFPDPTVRFAVVGNPRTGSSHLVSLLDSHPHIACWDCEIFDEGEEFDRSSFAASQDFLRERVFKVRAPVVGFKLLQDAMQRTPRVWHLLKEMDARLVHTYRDNYLDSYISFQLASLNNAFTSWYGDYKLYQIIIDYADCLEWIEAASRFDADLCDKARETGLPILDIEYKALCLDPGPVLDFLGLPRRPLVSQLKKQRSGTQSQIVINYTEIKARFAGSRWAACFED